MHYMASVAAGGVPSEIDHIYEHWTHYELIRQYAIKVASTARPAK